MILNPEILDRLGGYRPKKSERSYIYYDNDYNTLVNGIIDTDCQFWLYEKPTINRQVYFLTNQLIDILKLYKEGKAHKIQYEFADLFSMSFGYMSIYANPFDILKYRLGLNHKVKGEKNIVEKYECRFNKYGNITIDMLKDILRLHESEEYFKSLGAKNVL